MIAKALLGLGDIRIRQSRLAEARKFFQRSIGVSPQDEILAYNVGEIFFSGREYDEAVAYFRLAARIKPDWPDPYLKLGYVHLSKTENAEAVAQFERFLTLEGEGERAASIRAVLGTIRK
jgi:tetratricopeptide (TPR) repeat protein